MENEKAREFVLKELKNLENIVNLERENSRNQTSKRAFAENKLNKTTDEKNKEIEKLIHIVCRFKLRLTMGNLSLHCLFCLESKISHHDYSDIRNDLKR